jgi:uncharacterized membrane protein YfcA
VNAATLTFFCLTIMVIAILYSCVGQAGGSGFIAAMAVFGFAPDAIKPTALALNIFVSGIVALRFWQKGYFRWEMFWPLAILSIPCALIGGYVILPNRVFEILLGSILLLGSIPFFRGHCAEPTAEIRPPLVVSISIGGGIGLLSGLTAIGGGILLTPVLLFFRWARTKSAAAVSAMFIFVNSAAAMIGNLSGIGHLPSHMLFFIIAAGLGGLIGSYLGTNVLPGSVIRKILGAILFIAGIKLIAI